jgi:hydroxyethylthiazole kinase-like uncharacterized protein yjeF
MITSEKMRELEDLSEEKGISKLMLMQNAGRKLFEIISRKYDIKNKKTLVISNHGNNGGDGFVLANLMRQNNYDVKVYFFGKKEKLKKESGYNFLLLKDRFPDIFTEEPDITEYDIIVDALFGTGITGKIREPYSSLIDNINSSGKIIVSVDIPSGMDPDTGIYDKCVDAELVVTFHDIKQGMMKIQEKTVIADIGIEE